MLPKENSSEDKNFLPFNGARANCGLLLLGQSEQTEGARRAGKTTGAAALLGWPGQVHRPQANTHDLADEVIPSQGENRPRNGGLLRTGRP